MGARGWGCEWRSIDLGEAWRLRFLKDSIEVDPKFTECSSSYPSSLEDSSMLSELPQGTWVKEQNLLSKGA